MQLNFMKKLNKTYCSLILTHLKLKKSFITEMYNDIMLLQRILITVHKYYKDDPNLMVNTINLNNKFS